MSLKLRKRGKIWYMYGTVAGRRFRNSTGTAERKIAERIKAETEALAWKCHFDGPGAGLTMAQAFHAYLDAGRPDRFIAPLNDHWGDTPLDEVTPEAIRLSAQKIYPDANTATWNRQVIVPMQAAINYASRLYNRPEIRVQRFPVNPKVKEPVTVEWVNAFVEQAAKDGLPHLAALCLFMFGTAARVGESCRLIWDELDLSECTAEIHMEKPTPWSRSAHLQPTVVAALANIPSNRNPDELVFGYAARDSVTKVWNNVVARAGIKPLTPHCCRHGFATTMLQAGFDVKTVAERGGWKDPSVVLKTYAHAIKDKTVTNAIFDTNLSQAETEEPLTISKIKGKQA